MLAGTPVGYATDHERSRAHRATFLDREADQIEER
jgi:hypothetical protein